MLIAALLSVVATSSPTMAEFSNNVPEYARRCAEDVQLFRTYAPGQLGMKAFFDDYPSEEKHFASAICGAWQIGQEDMEEYLSTLSEEGLKKWLAVRKLIKLRTGAVEEE